MLRKGARMNIKSNGQPNLLQTKQSDSYWMKKVDLVWKHNWAFTSAQNLLADKRRFDLELYWAVPLTLHCFTLLPKRRLFVIQSLKRYMLIKTIAC